MEKVNVYDYVNERITAELEKGIIPWVKNWKGEQAINYVTRKPYRGINTILLPFSGEYMSFKQVQDLKGKIKKGEKANMVVFYKWLEHENDEGETETFPMLRYYNVFHLTQIEGIESKCEAFNPANENNIVIEAENIITDYTNRELIKFDIMLGSDKACYIPDLDKVVMPDIKQFDNAISYYSTAFHELTHSTGHSKRLDRFSKQKTHRFGSVDYSKEELVAEIGSAYLNNSIGIDNHEVFTNNIAYIQGWLKALKDDKKLITIAAGQAQKATNYILGIKEYEKVEA